MDPIKLDLDALRVDSFDTVSAASPEQLLEAAGPDTAYDKSCHTCYGTCGNYAVAGTC